MKCAHCSTRISRTDWFCPNCKRGIPRETVGPGRRLALTAGLAAGLLLGGIWVASPKRSHVSPPAAETFVPVSVRTVEPSGRPLPGEELRAALPAPAPAPVEIREQPAEPEAVSAEEAPARSREPHPRPMASAGVGAVSVMTDSEVETFVYLNGGSLLGKAPIQGATIPAGRQKLVFWSPSVGGRSTREVEIRAGQNMVLIHNVAPSSQFSGGG